MRTSQEAVASHRLPTKRTAGRARAERALAADARRDFTLALTQMRDHLYRLALALAHEPASADDLVQSTLERALQSRGQFRSGSNLKAWTCSILRNCFIDDCRRSRIVVHVQDLPVATFAEREIVPSDLFSIDDVRRIAQTLEDDVNRTVFDMAYFQRRPHREIAQQTGIHIGTVATRLHRLRRELRRRLLEDYAGPLAACGGVAVGAGDGGPTRDVVPPLERASSPSPVLT